MSEGLLVYYDGRPAYFPESQPMKVKGLQLSLPVCDWRFFLKPDSRLDCISPNFVQPEESFIRGFGRAEERPQFRTDWRETETVFFDCSRAISFPSPTRLPDGTRATKVVRRVYLDSKALVRFELALFDNAKHHYPYSKGRLDEFARIFWRGEVDLIKAGTRERGPLATGLPKLVRNFAEATSKGSTPPSSGELCAMLEPQILVIAEGRTSELETIARRIDAQGMVWVAVRSLRMLGQHIDTVYVMHVPEYLDEQFRTRFEHLRLIERQAAWLQADLSALGHIVRSCVVGRVRPEVVSEYVLDLAKGLLRVPELGDPACFLLTELMKVLRVPNKTSKYPATCIKSGTSLTRSEVDGSSLN